MKRRYWRTASRLALTLLPALILACGLGSLDGEGGHPTATPPPVISKTLAPAATDVGDNWALWNGGTELRGANIYQRRVYPELDGTEFLGPGPVGPPYTQQDLDDLAALGANYVNISHPGLFTETVPYTLDLDIQNNLDSLLDMIAQADMFAVISFRTGPGRAEFSVCCLGDDWVPESYYNDTVWQDQAAQDAWVVMWRHTAERYSDNPVVVGYDLMVEPNANEVLTGEWLNPEPFYDQYGGTLADWNQLYPRIVAAIREVDAHTPILIGGMGYSGVDWLPYLEPVSDSRTIYTIHQYQPHKYTHQPSDTPRCTYPGTCDTDWDDEYDDPLNRPFLEALLATVDDFTTEHDVPVAVNEFGVMRWEPGADAFMNDQMDLFEERGLNHALWAWEPAWEPWAEEVDAFNFRYGPDPANKSETPNDLQHVISAHWAQNTVRPSTPVLTTYVPLISRRGSAAGGE